MRKLAFLGASLLAFSSQPGFAQEEPAPATPAAETAAPVSAAAVQASVARAKGVQQ